MLSFAVCTLPLLAIAAAKPNRTANVPLDLVMLTDAQSSAKGAVCLDGTNPGFYWTKGSGSGAKKWVLYFKGGGWCYNEASCLARTKTSIGSAKHFTKTFAFSGIMDSQEEVNPTFYNANRVVLWYCDGASFSGDADAPNTKTGTKLYFRGKRVLDALLDTLLTEHDLDSAEEVLVSGGSAGGLAAFLHADYVRTKMPSTVQKFKASPVSGFFLLHDDDASPPVPLYPNEMEYVFKMQNSTSGVNAGCIASLPKAEQWRCIFANYSYAHTQAPIFPMNSAIDAWQMGNIWEGDSGCARADFANCTASEVKDLNGYMADFIADMGPSSSSPRDSPRARPRASPLLLLLNNNACTPAGRTSTFTKPGNGAFIESCLEHCGEQTGKNFDGYKLQGKSMQEAHSAWWAASAEESATEHTYLPGCKLSLTAPHQCNPTCAA